MTILGQPLYYWGIAVLAVLVIRSYVRTMILQRLYRARCDERVARAPEDAYWMLHRHHDYRSAMNITISRHSDRIQQLLADSHEQREQRLRAVS